jgi:hypothetical protein
MLLYLLLQKKGKAFVLVVSKYSLIINFECTFGPKNVRHISVKASTYLMFSYYFFCKGVEFKSQCEILMMTNSKI